MKKVLQVIGAIVVISIVISAATHHSSSNNGTNISLPNTTAVPASGSSTSSAPSFTPEPGPFYGAGDKNIGTITVPSNTVLHWQCGGCGQANFIVGNSATDGGLIDVNSLNQTSGQTVVDGGTYHDVSVTTEGQGWKLTFSSQ